MNAPNALLGPSKRRNRRVCWYPTPSDTPSDSKTKLPSLLADDAAEEVEKQDADCLYCIGRFSEDPTVERTGYEVRNVSDGSTHFVLVWRKIFYELSQG